MGTVGWAWVGVGVAVLVAVVALWLSWTATRLDRMHLRAEAAMAALQAQLQRRAAVAAELAVGGLSNPASALALLDAARAAREAEDGEPSERWVAESELTGVLHEAGLPPYDVEPLMPDLVDAGRRAALGRGIYNDLVATTLALHQRRRVRWFRLAGHAVPPQPAEFDDRYDFAAPE